MKRPSKRSFKLIYPHYFDINRSRAQGRKVSKEIAIRMPSEMELKASLEAMGFEYQVQYGKAYPRNHLARSFRILVFTEMKKSDLMKNIAIKLRGNLN